jgi:hypothetical protein
MGFVINKIDGDIIENHNTIIVTCKENNTIYTFEYLGGIRVLTKKEKFI